MVGENLRQVRQTDQILYPLAPARVGNLASTGQATQTAVSSTNSAMDPLNIRRAGASSRRRCMTLPQAAHSAIHGELTMAAVSATTVRLTAEEKGNRAAMLLAATAIVHTLGFTNWNMTAS